MINNIWLRTYALKLNLTTDWRIYLPYVSSSKKQQAVKFIHQADAVRTVWGELLTRAAIVELLGRDNASIQFAAGTYGKPALQDAPNFHFNISHAGEWVVGAFSNCPAGIDVERVVPVDPDLPEAVLSNAELCCYSELPEAMQLDYFYHLWTLKESFLKATGQGLSVEPIVLTIQQDGQNRIECLLDSRRYPASLRELSLDCHYRAAICLLAEEIPPVQIEYKTMPWINALLRKQL